MSEKEFINKYESLLSFLNLVEYFDKDNYENEFTLEMMRKAEFKLEPLHKNFYYPCLVDICNEHAPHCHYASASKEQRLIAMSIVMGW